MSDLKKSGVYDKENQLITLDDEATMVFGITEIVSGWFGWYLRDNTQKVEFTASRYCDVDFVKQLLENITDIIRYRKENIFSFFSEPGFVTIKMKVDDIDMFTMELACSDREISLIEDITQSKIYHRFSISMFRMRTEFVPTILKSFQHFQKNLINLDYYDENWTVAIETKNSDSFSFPFNELQELHQIASDIRIK